LTAGGVTSFDAGRGCPYQCSFCTIINVQGRKSRRRSPDDVEKIVRANIAQGARSFFITDDNFARNKDWEAILDRLIYLREVEKMPIGIIQCNSKGMLIDRINSINIDQVRDQRVGAGGGVANRRGGPAVAANEPGQPSQPGPAGPNGADAQAVAGGTDQPKKETPLYKHWWFWPIAAASSARFAHRFFSIALLRWVRTVANPISSSRAMSASRQPRATSSAT